MKARQLKEWEALNKEQARLRRKINMIDAGQAVHFISGQQCFSGESDYGVIENSSNSAKAEDALAKVIRDLARGFWTRRIEEIGDDLKELDQ